MQQIMILNELWYPGEGMGRLGPTDTRIVDEDVAAELIGRGDAKLMGEMPFDIVAFADEGWKRRTLQEKLKGVSGGEVHIVGCGPSANNFKPPEDGLTICCNAAGVRFRRHSTINIVVEGESVHSPWFAGLVGANAITIFDRLVAHFLTADIFDQAHESWWLNVIWDKRRPHYADLQSMEDGLIYHRRNMRGTVMLSAYGVALGMGAKTVHWWGGEMCWEKGQAQHFDGWSPYEEKLIRGAYTTEYLYQGAEACAEIMLEHPEVEVVNHSGGLVERILGEMREAQAEAQAEYDARSKE